jgi:cell wall-associated NlpC family hydrolase
VKLAPKIVALAKAEIGVEEIDGTNCGPRVNEYKAATNLPPKESWPWCAAFVCWLVREAMNGGEYTFKRPTTAGAWAFEAWSLAQDNSTWTKKPHRGDIKPGDIVIFKFSHIGIAVTAPDSKGNLLTIEGNTDGAGSREGGAVLRKRRREDQIRSRIRFMV